MLHCVLLHFSGDFFHTYPKNPKSKTLLSRSDASVFFDHANIFLSVTVRIIITSFKFIWQI